MRLLHMSNIVSHHQLPLARCLADLVGNDNFRFAATGSPSGERQRLGFKCDDPDPWILRAGDNEADCKQCERWCKEADVVLFGERLFDRMKERLDNGKLTFYMSERWWKPPIGMARLLHPRFALMTKQFLNLTSSPFLHYLALGDYAAADMKRIASFTGRMWRWGYFTTTPDPLPSCSSKENGFRVLWAGRMVPLKRVDTVIKSFSRLLDERAGATLTLVGEGSERERLEQLAEKILSKGSYCFLPPMPASEIPRLMRQCHVYVLPSNGCEGWGAVVNEAMAEGCVVIASEAAGAAKTIIRRGENGLLFEPGDWKRLGELLCKVARDESWRMQLAREGQRTIVESWSPAVAANRFVSVCNALLSKQTPPLFRDGPMTPVW